MYRISLVSMGSFKEGGEVTLREKRLIVWRFKAGMRIGVLAGTHHSDEIEAVLRSYMRGEFMLWTPQKKARPK